MTTKCTYECNFCRGSMQDVFCEDATGRKGVGLQWNGSGGTMLIKRPYETENHLCLGCLRAIKALQFAEIPGFHDAEIK